MMRGKASDPLKNDVWALGVALYTMLARRLLYEFKVTDESYPKIVEMMEEAQLSDVNSATETIEACYGRTWSRATDLVAAPPVAFAACPLCLNAAHEFCRCLC